MKRKYPARMPRLKKMPMAIALALGGLYRYRLFRHDDSGRNFIYGVTIPKTIQGYWYCQRCDETTNRIEASFIWKSSVKAA